MVEQRPIPMVLHGGTGLAPEQFQDLIARGCAKVNISTALKIAFVDAHREYLEANPAKKDPPALLKHVARGREGHGDRAHADLRLGRQGARRRWPPDAGADLRLRRRAGRHRALRAPARLQRDLRAGGLPVRWSEADYGEKLLIGGGKERMASLLTDDFVREHGLPADPEGQRELLARWHRRKTAAYKALRRGGRAARPPGHRPDRRRGARRRLDARGRLHVGRGVRARGARARGRRGEGGALQRAAPATSCRPRSPTPRSTCSRWSARARTRTRRSSSRTPATACSRRSAPGCAAWSPSAATPQDEDFSEAVLVVSSLGDPGEPARVLANRGPARARATYVTLDDLQACLRVPAPQEVT